MAENKYSFKVGDRVRGKNTELVAVVVKILDAGYLMVHEEEFDMDLNILCSEVVLDQLNPLEIKNSSPIKTDKRHAPIKVTQIRIDLHYEKLPARFKSANSSPLEAQLDYLKERLAVALRESHKVITLIHGKGAGTLHKACLNLLKTYPQCRDLKVLKVALEPPHGIEIVLK